ncbi:MAG: hypothetical protein ACREN5_13520 [Gemmatimonadales bacterium]
MSATVAREVTAVSPAPAAPAATPSGAGGWIVAASVLLFNAALLAAMAGYFVWLQLGWNHIRPA